MHKIKIFKGIESDVEPLENEVNAWLAANHARVVHMTGNIAPQSGSGKSSLGSLPNDSDVIIILVYELAE